MSSSPPFLSPILKPQRSASTDSRASTPFIVVRSSNKITSRGEDMNSQKIRFLVKRMSNKDTLQKSESQIINTTALINICEERTEDFVLAGKPLNSSEFTLAKNENSPSKPNIFQTDKVDQTKFFECNQQGPMFQNGKVLKRSIVGPVEIFERQQRFANRSKSTIRFSVRPSEGETNRVNLSLPYNENENMNGSMVSQQGRYSLLNVYHRPKPKKGIEPPPQLIIPKDEVLKEIQDIALRQKEDLSRSTQILPEKNPLRCLSARVYHTKQQRNLVKFDQQAQYWQKSIQNINDKIGRSGMSSVMMSLNKHREKREMDNMLEILKRNEDGTNHWEKNLRKPSESKLERAISTGSLFASVKERMNTDESDTLQNSVEVIRKPNLMMIPLEKQTRPASQAAIDKTQREYLNSRISNRKDLIKSVQPPEIEQVKDLAIKGENKFNLERAQLLKELNNSSQVIVLKDLFEGRQVKYADEVVVRNRNSIQITHRGLGTFIK